jgi:hypothetical protein
MLNFLRTFLPGWPQSDAVLAVRKVQARLDGHVSQMILAQAKARALRRVAQGCPPLVAAHLAITWAINAYHPEPLP